MFNLGKNYSKFQIFQLLSLLTKKSTSSSISFCQLNKQKPTKQKSHEMFAFFFFEFIRKVFLSLKKSIESQRTVKEKIKDLKSKVLNIIRSKESSLSSEGEMMETLDQVPSANSSQSQTSESV